MGEDREGGRFYFVGNHLCLDFVNTQVIDGGRVVDLLGGYAAFISWCGEAGIVEAGGLEQWVAHPDGERVYARALEFRAALRETAERLAGGRPAPQRAVALINEVLRERAGYEELVRVRGGYERRFNLRIDGPSQLLVPVAESAAELLSEGDPALVRKCENPSCILYFYDSTKNHARRWCSMSGCGNRAKAAAHYRRKRGEA